MSCKSPKFRKNAGTVVACGQCTPCLLKKQREKTSRVLLEDRSGLGDPLFVSLTYDDAHLPKYYLHEHVDRETGEVTETPYYCETGTLYPPDIPSFLKRLRYRADLRQCKVRCVYAGEYGDKERRPHYHLITWGIPYRHREIFWEAWIDENKIPMCDPSRLDVQIPKSERHVANYCAKYILTGENKKDCPKLNGAYPEFYRTSKGLGLKYAQGIANALSTESGLANLWIDGKIPSSFIIDGKNFPIDRYMKGKILALLPPVFAEELQKKAIEDYKAEVHSVYEDALNDPSFKKKIEHLEFEDALELAMQEKNAARAAEVETRYSFFNNVRKSNVF